MDIYGQITAIADQHGWPSSFATDITTHDRNALGNTTAAFPVLPGDRLLWILRESGSHLLRLEKGRDSLRRLLTTVLVDCWADQAKTIALLTVDSLDKTGQAIGTAKVISQSKAFELASIVDAERRVPDPLRQQAI